MNAVSGQYIQLSLWPPSGQVSAPPDTAFIPGAGPSSFRDLTGNRFGRLTVENESDPQYTFFHGRKIKKRMWNCGCDCGNKLSIRACSLLSGNTKSCGCLLKDYLDNPPNKENLTGKRFGKWTVQNEAFRRNKSGRLRRFWNCTCECGVRRQVSQASLRQGQSVSCGCYQKQIIKNINRTKQGSNSPHWNAALTEEERVDRRKSIKYSEWRNNIFKLDNYICVACQQKGCSLVAHHVDGYHWAKDKRFDMKNGVTLCKKCHSRFHKKYGNRNNTQKQFDQFLRQYYA
jgi:hypothetical protein